MTKEPDPSFNVIVDTREKNPWQLTSSCIRDTIYKKIDAGDYTVEGLEDILCIERKMSVAEIAQNVTTKRFVKALERMSECRFKYLLLEATLDDVINYPKGADLPPKALERVRITGGYVLRCINRMEVKYGIHFIFCGNRYNASWVATNIMKEAVRIIDNETKNKN